MVTDNNPFASPETPSASVPRLRQLTILCLIPLWTWSFVSATLGLFAMFQVEPATAYLLMLCTLGWLCLGAFVVSSIAIAIRLTALGVAGPLLLIVTSMLFPSADALWPFLIQFAILSAFHMGMGSWICRVLPYGRFPIFAFLGLGFVLGMGVSLGLRNAVLHFVSVVTLSIAGSLVGYALATHPTRRQPS